MFVTFDGPDGGGKSTQARLLAEWLRGRGLSVVECRDPGSTPLGEALRRILLDPHGEQKISLASEALIYMAARAQLVAEVIEPALAAGRAVVSDRFLLANVVYQGYAGGLNVEELWTVGRLATGGRSPELSLVLDVPVEVAASRISRPLDRIEGRGVEFQERVRQGFLIEARRRPEVVVIDARGDVDAIQQQVRRIAEERMFGGREKPWGALGGGGGPP